MEQANEMFEQLETATRRLEPGETLVKRGDTATEVFLIRAGRLAVEVPIGDAVAVLGEVGIGDVVGEVATLLDHRRSATLRALEATEVSVASYADVDRWLARHPVAAAAFAEPAVERIDRSAVVELVAGLVGVDDPTLVIDLVGDLQWRRWSAGETIFEQGDPSDGCCFVVDGRVAVLADDRDGSAREVRRLGAGEVFGELGLLDAGPRTATVRAVRDSTVAFLPDAAFERCLVRNPALFRRIGGVITARERDPMRGRSERTRAIAVAVTTNDPPGRLDEVVLDEISRFGSVVGVDARLVGDLLGTPGAPETDDDASTVRVRSLLHEAEVEHEHVVMFADRGLTPWTRRLLRNADRVVIVSSARAGADERRAIAGLLDAIPFAETRRMLAMVHPASAERPHGTAAATAALAVDDVIHVRHGSGADLRRLARLASGHGVGVVLGSGAARGFAHIGVLRALVENGVPLDRLAGCSIGAPLAAGIATGFDVDRLLAETKEQFHRLLDVTIPVVSLLKAGRITRNIERSLGGWDIEDLWIPFYCVSTNLTRLRLEHHDRGDLAHAVRASVSLPGIMPPVSHGDDLLVDGGVLAGLPHEPMRTDPTIGTVIAIDVAPPKGPPAYSDPSSLSGLRALADVLRPGGAPHHNVVTILMSSVVVGAMGNQLASMTEHPVDLYLRLDLPDVGLLDFERVEEIADRGYADSVEGIRAWACGQPAVVGRPPGTRPWGSRLA